MDDGLIGYRPLRFIGEQVEVRFAGRPALEKRPGVPEGFVWAGKHHAIMRVLSEWHDYTRRGKMARNMRPENAEHAALRGSRGVGRDYYRVETDSGRLFDIYYDRAPRSVVDTKGAWFLFREIARTNEESEQRTDETEGR